MTRYQQCKGPGKEWLRKGCETWITFSENRLNSVSEECCGQGEVKSKEWALSDPACACRLCKE